MENHGKFIGLIGLGYWGKNILRNLCEIGALHTACDSEPLILSERQERFRDINFTTSLDDVLNEPDIKAVAIATPAATHYDLVKQALLKGKDVFVEKPLALSVNEGEDLVALAKKENRVLMVGHILQYHPAVKKLKELIDSGELGKIQYIYSNRLNIGKLRTEENILWSFAPHDISVILMLLGEEPVKVSAFGGDYLNSGVYDTTLTTLEFKNEIKSHIFVSWLHPYKEQRLIFVGSKAMAVFDDVSEEKLFVYPHKIEWKNGKIPVAHKADYDVVPVEKGEPLKQELEHFADCVLWRKRPVTDGVEGLKVLKILDAAQKGLTRGKDAKTESRTRNYHLHESAYIDADTSIDEGTRIWHFSHVLKGSRIGKNCIIGQNVTVGPDAVIGDRCKIQNNVSVYKGVILEDEVFCGPSCVFTNVYNPRAFIERKHEFRQTLVKKGATLGANSTIVCGVKIGEYSMIGAGAVVKTDVPDHAIVAGVPARQIGWTCRCGTTLRFNDKQGICADCDNEYMLDNDHLITIKERVLSK
ncbi:MAG: Gfo/Idh/MocA family oxidoreductase [Nitrospirae bacterium]|nr:Gfo/Idh/MocA family oxidoreductase [Nitrospirota bacterium]